MCVSVGERTRLHLRYKQFLNCEKRAFAIRQNLLLPFKIMGSADAGLS